jgi:hypothetical protein
VVEIPMTNLFPLPCWAPALKRVPLPLQALDQAFVHGIDFAPVAFEADRALDPALSFSPFAAPLSPNGEDVSRIAPG